MFLFALTIYIFCNNKIMYDVWRLATKTYIYIYTLVYKKVDIVLGMVMYANEFKTMEK